MIRFLFPTRSESEYHARHDDSDMWPFVAWIWVALIAVGLAAGVQAIWQAWT